VLDQLSPDSILLKDLIVELSILRDEISFVLNEVDIVMLMIEKI